MGYRGKVAERNRARDERAKGWTLADIAHELKVSKSSVSLWVRDVPFTPPPGRTGGRIRPTRRQAARLAEIAAMDAEGKQRLGELCDLAHMAAGAALYAGEGSKTQGKVKFANSDPAMVAFFCRWLRHYFDIDEARLRVCLYLHQGLDLDTAIAFWSGVTGIPASQFGKPYRAVPDPSIRTSKHPMGCVAVVYSCTRTHRAVMGLCRALLTSRTAFRGSSIGRAFAC